MARAFLLKLYLWYHYDLVLGKLFSANGQLAMSLFEEATPEQRAAMDFIPLKLLLIKSNRTV